MSGEQGGAGGGLKWEVVENTPLEKEVDKLHLKFGQLSFSRPIEKSRVEEAERELEELEKKVAKEESSGRVAATMESCRRSLRSLKDKIEASEKEKTSQPVIEMPIEPQVEPPVSEETRKEEEKNEPEPVLVEQHPATEEVAPAPPAKEENREKWRAELRELFESSRLIDVLEELDKDPNLAQAQKSFHFSDNYALYRFDIQMKIKQAKACIQECKNSSVINLGSHINMLEALDPLTKLVGLPESIGGKINAVIKPFLEKFQVLMSKQPEQNGKIVKLFYPRHNSDLIDEQMRSNGGEKSMDNSIDDLHVARCIRPGKFSVDTRLERHKTDFSGAITPARYEDGVDLLDKAEVLYKS